MPAIAVAEGLHAAAIERDREWSFARHEHPITRRERAQRNEDIGEQHDEGQSQCGGSQLALRL